MNQFENDICGHFSKSYMAIFKYALNASKRYRRYTIPKRTTGKRVILQPSAELKTYQSYLVSYIFEKFPCHDSVYSYQKNKNIKQMASLHLNAHFLLRIDFKDFFPSIKSQHIRKFLNEKSFLLDNILSDNDITLINLLVCRNGNLTIGAPSSPMISNIILYDLDEYLFSICKEMGIVYTRYADDLYFSTSNPNILKNILSLLKTFLKTFFLDLLVNEDKNIYTSKKRRQQVTGLILTNDGKISVGRDMKRYIKSLIFKYRNDQLEQSQINYLRGYLSYLYSVEPEYIENLKNKYTPKLMQELFTLKQQCLF
ncbi:MAG: retron St85 family RNA-directed DNA polymerase [Sulfuricurvum sp.]|nr:retron St85 family RNA-directed DNA polymerase [Sulfuricurvum sp.]